jgi:hypothetical protein
MAKQLAVDRQGHIYAFELEAILKFGPDGRFLNRVGSRGSGPGEWSAPQNIGWMGTAVYTSASGAAFMCMMATAASSTPSPPTPT